MVEDHMAKHVLPSSTAKNGRTEKEVPLEKSTVNMLPKRDGKRKQRPSGRSTTRGKATVKQPRRAKFASKPARIDENESSESDASEEIRKNKLGGSDNEENCEFDRWNGENISDHGSEIPVDYVNEDSKPLTEGKEILQECVDDSGVGGEWNASKTLSFPVDPVQSILLNMIPSLEKKSSSVDTPLEHEKVMPSLEKTSSSTVEHVNVMPRVEKKSGSSSMDMGVEHEKPPLDLTPNPIKKKKVSYKDVVGALLKDW